MLMPALDDTIIAVSSGWQAAPLGIVRLSGPAAFELIRQVGISQPPAGPEPRPHWHEDSLSIAPGLELPVTVFCFHAPRSYTGQDVAELHTVGSLPALRGIAARLIELGARRALPGEFTSRAFLNGRLDAGQVDRVLALINAEDETAARQAARLERSSAQSRIRALNDRLTELIAHVEAGIDFVEEEDVRFVTPAELARSIDELLARIAAITPPDAAFQRMGKPHVALAGLPNAGKSTLFNALIGCERAIVTPLLGTTRDVLSAEIVVDGIALVLQDCAGLGAATDDLEAAAHLAAEAAADQADLVLWVHDAGMSFEARELETCRRIPAERRLLVVSKLDQSVDKPAYSAPLPFYAAVLVSALTGVGLADLRRAIARRLDSCDKTPSGLPVDQLRAVAAALHRARDATDISADDLVMPEIVASELRRAWEAVGLLDRGPLAEDVLSKILARFCIGK